MGYSQTSAEKVSEVLNNLKNLNFESTQQSINSIDNERLKVNLAYLKKVFHHRDEFVTLKTNIKAIDTTGGPLEKGTSFLALGYEDLFTDSRHTKSYNYLLRAIDISVNNNFKALEKQAILGIFEFYRREIHQGNSQFLPYLERHKSLSIDDTDFYWNILYEIIFYTQTKELDPRFYERLDEITTLSNQSNTINKRILPEYQIQLAYKHELEKNQDAAIALYERIIEENKDKVYHKRLVFKSYIRLSVLNGNRQRYNVALQNLNDADSYGSISDSLLSKFYILRYKADNFGFNGDFKNAYESLQKSLDIEYDLDYRRNSLQISSLEVELDTAKKEKQILVEQEQKRKNRNLALFLGGGLLLVSFIAILVYKNTKRKQRIAEQEREIEIQKTEKVLKEQELSAIDAMLEGQEKERQRLASDLHDSAGATIAAARLHFDNLAKDNASVTSKIQFERTKALLDQAYEEVRSMAHIKNSGVIAKQGLLPAIENLARQVSMSELQITVSDYGLTERIDNSLEITIFRIVQELVTNIVKHSKATEAHISLTQHDDSLNIVVEDNGKGFKYDKNKSENGMGLSSIRRRVTFINGSFDVESSPNQGTTILIDIPL